MQPVATALPGSVRRGHRPCGNLPNENAGITNARQRGAEYGSGADEQDPSDVAQEDIDQTLSMLSSYDIDIFEKERQRRIDEAIRQVDLDDIASPSDDGAKGARAGFAIYQTYIANNSRLEPDGVAREEKWKKTLETQIEVADQDNHKFIYFMFGDLLDYIISEAKRTPIPDGGVTEADLQNIKVLVGSCDISVPGNPIYPITHIPISWLSFRNFWYKKVIRPKKDKYPLLQLIRDMIRDLLFGTLNSVYYNPSSRKFNNSFKSAFVSIPRQASVTGTGISSIDPVRAASIKQGYGGIKIDLSEFTLENPLAFLNPRTKTQDMSHYMCIFVEDGKKGQFARKAMLQAMGGSQSRKKYNREQLNIHHFGFGEDRGVLKSANFSKTDQPYLRESRYLEKGGDPLVQLSNVYEASITLFGAPFFYPGQYVWITPYGLSKSKNQSFRLGSPDAGPIRTDDSYKPGSIANIMGLGGYHIIIDVQGIIEDGLYEVKLNARFDNSGADAGDREGYGSKEVRRCEDDEGPNVNP